SVAFSQDARMVLTGSTDQSARLWETGTGALLKQLKEKGETQKEDDDKSKEAAATSWFLTKGAQQLTAVIATDSFSAAFANNDRRVVTGDMDQEVLIWNIEDGKFKEIAGGAGFEYGVRKVAVSPDG